MGTEQRALHERLVQAFGLPAQGGTNVSVCYIQSCIPGETSAMSSSAKPTRVIRPFAARAVEVLAPLANVLATLANIASALAALVMIAHAAPLMALAWVLLAAGAFGVLAAQIGPAKDGRSVHDDEWEDER